MTTPTAPRPMADLVARQNAQREAEEILLAAMKKTHSESDRRAYAMDLWLIAHPEACHTAADYPGWVPGCPTCPPNDSIPGGTS